VSGTQSSAYTERLVALGGARWKKLLNVQAPYRWNMRRLRLGRTLDVGCGIGRVLAHLDGNAVGVDHNPASVDVCRGLGFEAYLPAEFFERYAGRRDFDSVLLAHVVEHMRPGEAIELIEPYLECLKPGGRLVLLTPQESGFRSDPTHVHFTDFGGQRRIVEALGMHVERQFSFPFPRTFGGLFKYNEFVCTARR
jgi:SAM-dependent methyltransferase